MTELPPEQNQPEKKPPSLELLELARAKLDLSTDNENGGNRHLRNLLRTFEAASLGIGVASLSYPLASSMVEQAAGSMMLRSTAGILAGITFLKADQKLSADTARHSFSQFLEKKDYPRLTATIFRQGLRTIAFWAFLPTLMAIWSDLSENEETAYQLEAIRTKIETWMEDAGMTPAFLELQADFQTNIIASLDKDGTLTPQALAKMALYNDGAWVQWNSLEYEGPREKTWLVSEYGMDWTIICYDINHWYVAGPTIAWELDTTADLGEEVVGETVGETLQKKFPNDPLAKTLEKRLKESGLTNGNPAIMDILKGVTPMTTSIPPSFNQGLDDLSGFLPTELNRDIRRRMLHNAKQIEADYSRHYAAEAMEVKEHQFGVDSLQDPHSYASILSFIDSSTLK